MLYGGLLCFSCVFGVCCWFGFKAELVSVAAAVESLLVYWCCLPDGALSDEISDNLLLIACGTFLIIPGGWFDLALIYRVLLLGLLYAL